MQWVGGGERCHRRRLRREASAVEARRLAVCLGEEGLRNDLIGMERGLRGGQSWEHLERHAQECVYSCLHRGEPHGKCVNSVQKGHWSGGCPSSRAGGKARASCGAVSTGGEEGTCQEGPSGRGDLRLHQRLAAKTTPMAEEWVRWRWWHTQWARTGLWRRCRFRRPDVGSLRQPRGGGLSQRLFCPSVPLSWPCQTPSTLSYCPLHVTVWRGQGRVQLTFMYLPCTKQKAWKCGWHQLINRTSSHDASPWVTHMQTQLSGRQEPLVTLTGSGMTSCFPLLIQRFSWLLFSTTALATRVCDIEGDLFLVFTWKAQKRPDSHENTCLC